MEEQKIAIEKKLRSEENKSDFNIWKMYQIFFFALLSKERKKSKILTTTDRYQLKV